MAIAHGTRKHSRIGPSAAHRWMACPGSVRASKHIENKGTVYTQEGTAAHEFAEFVMRTRIDPQTYLGGIIDLREDDNAKKFCLEDASNDPADDWNVWQIDDEMIEAVDLYRDTIDSYVISPDDTIVEFETRLDMRHIHPDFFGTGDTLIFRLSNGHLIVIDFKFGRGVAVEVEDNEQLMSYAVGAAHRFSQGNHRFERLTLVVVQPRAYHPNGPVRVQDNITAEDLARFTETLREKTALTDADSAPFLAGDHCRWCPVAHNCSVLSTYVDEITANVATEFGDEVPEPKDMSAEALARVVLKVAMIEGWLRKVMQVAHERALNGVKLPGVKVVDKRAYRKFTDTAEVLDRLKFSVLDEDEYMTPRKLRSPAQIESAIGKKDFQDTFGDLVLKRSSGFVLAAEGDRRKAVKLDKSDAFGAVEDD